MSSANNKNAFQGSVRRVDDASDEATESSSLLGAGRRESRDVPTSDYWPGYEDFEGLPWYKKPSVWWLIGPYAIFTLAFGGTLVPKLNLIVDLVCQKYFSDRVSANPKFIFRPVHLGDDNPQCNIPEVQKHVAAFMLVLNVIIGVLSSFTVPRLGALADRYGRKRLMIVSSFGGIASEIITILAARFPNVIHYQWLILGAFFDGLAGSFTSGSALSNSYTSDCTPPSKRGPAIANLHACLFTGLALGPLLAGHFVKWTGSLVSIFYVTLGCHLFFILFLVFVLPESLSEKKQMLARERHAKAEEEARVSHAQVAAGYEGDRLASVKMMLYNLKSAHPFAPLKIFWPTGPNTGRLRQNLVLLAAIDTVLLGAVMSSGQVVLLYSEYMFGWGNFETSNFISAISFVRAFVLMVVARLINYVFRTRPAARRRRESGVAIVEKNTGSDGVDNWIMRTALFSDVLGITGYIFARTPSVFVLCGIITAFGGLGSATIQASITKHMPPERVGQLLGATGLLHALSRVVVPMIFNSLYAGTVEMFPQAVFILLAAMLGVVLLLSFFVRPHVYAEDKLDDDLDSSEAYEDSAAANEALLADEIIP